MVEGNLVGVAMQGFVLHTHSTPQALYRSNQNAVGILVTKVALSIVWLWSRLLYVMFVNQHSAGLKTSTAVHVHVHVLHSYTVLVLKVKR